MEEIPRELDWVKERAACTIDKMFVLLHKAVEDDAKRVNEIRRLPDYAAFEVILNREGDIFTVKAAEALKPYVKFTKEDDTIIVSSDPTTVDMVLRVGLSDEGRCKLTDNASELEQWQVRKIALEGLFFPPGAPIR
jgi:hypothetical protein